MLNQAGELLHFQQTLGLSPASVEPVTPGVFFNCGIKPAELSLSSDQGRACGTVP